MISLLHPSRGRSGKAYITYSNWIRKAGNKENIEHILSLDVDDLELDRYKLLFQNSTILINNNTCAVQATNEAAKVAKGDILIMLSDDFDCPESWDKIIEDAIETGKLLKVFDGTQRWIVTLAIMDRKYYEKYGYFYYPEYKHLFVDTDLTHKAELEGRLIFRNDIVFTHNHYTTGRSKKDATTERADATWKQGENLYLRRCKEKFGLPETTDILALGKEATQSGHMQWLQDKLNGGNAKMRLPRKQKLFH